VVGARSGVLRRRDPPDGGRPAEGEVRSRRGQAAGPGRLTLTGRLTVTGRLTLTGRLAAAWDWAGELVPAADELAVPAGLLPELVPEQAARPGTATAAMVQAAIRPGFMVSP
jgi:hypothetical protein